MNFNCDDTGDTVGKLFSARGAGEFSRRRSVAQPTDSRLARVALKDFAGELLQRQRRAGH
jgi:hypothetical protein